MVPQIKSRRAGLRKFVGIALFSIFLVLHAGAFQTRQIQIEAKEAGRKIKNRIPPEYPQLALRSRMEGTARVEMVVTPEGSVKDVKELGGNPVLLEALVQAVKQWKYEPAPRETVMEIKAAFVY